MASLPRQPFRRVLISTSAVLVLIASSEAQVIFEDGLSSDAAWTIVTDEDTNIGFGFDYSADPTGIPAAPNGNDTIGLYTLVNFSEPAAVAELAAVYFNPDLRGQYTVSVDVWNNWHLHADDNPTNIGTTEFTGLGVGHTGESSGREAASFLYDGDGDSGSDYRLYRNDEFQALDTGQYILQAYEVDGVRQDLNHINPQFIDAFPELDVSDVVPSQQLVGTQRAGAAGFQWVTLTAEVDTEAIGVGTTDDPGVATFRMFSHNTGEEITIGAIDNSNGDTPVNMEGSISLIMADLFTSVSPSLIHSFGVFDNVKIVRGIGGGGPTVDVDFDQNGTVDVADVDGLVAAIVAGDNNASFDLNNDALVNGGDLTKWLTDAATENGFAGAYLRGDANLDGFVDAADLNVVGIGWQEAASAWSAGDFSADGFVDAADLNDLGVNWQKATPTAAAVPEPATSGLLWIMALLLLPIMRCPKVDK